MKKGIVCLGLFIAFFCRAQRNEPVTFNDKVPDVAFAVTKNYPGKTARLSDFKGKAIILDFWNEHCASCIKGFPKLQQLQNEFGDQLQVLLVTNDKKERIQQLIMRSPIMKGIQLPLIMEDSILYKELFPHYGDPYQVWLDKDWRVKAMTMSSAATKSNVQDLISGKPLQLSTVTLLDTEEDAELFGQEIYEPGQVNPKITYKRPVSFLKIAKGKYLPYLLYYSAASTAPGHSSSGNYSLFAKHLGPLGSIPGSPVKLYDTSGNRVNGARWINQPLLTMLHVVQVIVGSDRFEPTESKTIIEEDAIEAPPPGTGGDFEYDQWAIRNGYCYETRLANYSMKSFFLQLQQDIALYFKVTAVMEERPVKCMVLYCIGTQDLIGAKNSGEHRIYENTESGNGIFFQQVPFSTLLSNLWNANRHITDPLVVDETGIPETKLIDMNLKVRSLHHSDPELQKELARYGLGIKTEIRNKKVMVIKKIKE